MKGRPRKNKTRRTYFCVGISEAFKGKNAIHVLLKKLRNKHNLKWLRISMSYHKFANLGELFSGDLTGKVMKGVESLDFMDRDCNCNRASMVDGNCIFGGDCRKCIVVYKCTCICGKFYIGSTQNSVKKRMHGHWAETRSLINNGATADSFARHFASHFCEDDGEKKSKKKSQVSITQIRKLMKVSILWQGKAISNMKTFGKLNCTLCMRERMELLKAKNLDKMSKIKNLINSSTEVYGACRHKPKFHRFAIFQY